MPETTETATFDRPAPEVFAHLADFGRLAEWDPMFTSSRKLDDGPVGLGSRFEAIGSIAGREFELELEIVEYDEPGHVRFNGTGDGLSTMEDITVAPDGAGCEVTYHSAFETDKSDLLDAASAPAFQVVGKRAIRGMRDWLGN
jgi:hypothetical protein